jgi:hypothetical protein
VPNQRDQEEERRARIDHIIDEYRASHELPDGDAPKVRTGAAQLAKQAKAFLGTTRRKTLPKKSN